MLGQAFLPLYPPKEQPMVDVTTILGLYQLWNVPSSPPAASAAARAAMYSDRALSPDVTVTH